MNAPLQHGTHSRHPVAQVSLLRLYVLRAMYLVIMVGLGLEIWPVIVQHERPWTLMHGVALCLLATVSTLAALGIRYPLQMLPLLFFEVVWKSIWLLVVALPLWSAHEMDAATLETARACLMGVVVLLVIPWRYAFHRYVVDHGDRWR